MSRNDAMDVFGNALRSTRTEKRKTKNRIRVKVLAPPVPTNERQLASIEGGAPGTTAHIGEFRFKGRIVEPEWADNPHLFLGDPCTMEDTATISETVSAISLHTTCVSTNQGDGNEDMPSAGDIVLVNFDPNEFSINMQRAEYIGMKRKNGATVPVALSFKERCTKLADHFKNADTGIELFGESEQADKLRCQMDSYKNQGMNISEKGNQLSSFGDLSPEMANAANTIFRAIYVEGKGKIGLQVTAGNDVSHSGTREYVSRHKKGNAMDFTIRDTTGAKPAPDAGKQWNKDETGAFGNNVIVKKVNEILTRIAAGNSKFRFIDEYNYPTGYASAEHFHVSWGLGSEGLSTSQAALVSAASGSIVPISITSIQDSSCGRAVAIASAAATEWEALSTQTRGEET